MWKMAASSPEGSQTHYLQLADAVLKRVPFEIQARIVERRLPHRVSKVG